MGGARDVSAHVSVIFCVIFLLFALFHGATDAEEKTDKQALRGRIICSVEWGCQARRGFGVSL